MLFQKDKLLVRSLEKNDSFLLAKWLSDPLVLEFYEGRDNPFNLEKVIKKFFKRENDVQGCIVNFDGVDIGYIQYYQLDDVTRINYGYEDNEIIYGTDQFIGETAYWNKGIGKLLVKSMIEYLVGQRNADKVVMDPQTWNERAIKCYEKCGFKKVKILPKNEFHEGEYRDCWLVEYNK